MKNKATFEDLQQRIKQLSEDKTPSNFDFQSVSPNDKEVEVLNFETSKEDAYNYVTEWEM